MHGRRSLTKSWKLADRWSAKSKCVACETLCLWARNQCKHNLSHRDPRPPATRYARCDRFRSNASLARFANVIPRIVISTYTHRLRDMSSRWRAAVDSHWIPQYNIAMQRAAAEVLENVRPLSSLDRVCLVEERLLAEDGSSDGEIEASWNAEFDSGSVKTLPLEGVLFRGDARTPARQSG